MTSDAVVAYARTFLGVPYKWGGNNRLTGMDCSGFVCEVLRSFAIVGGGEDLSANDLFVNLKKRAPFLPPSSRYEPGTVVFFGSADKVTHVAIMVDRLRVIEAGGGGSHCTDLPTAMKLSAMVRERPLAARADLVGAVLPPYPDTTSL